MAVSVAGKEPKELMEMAAKLVTEAQTHHSENADKWNEECEAKHKALIADAMLCKTTANRIKELKDIHDDRASNVERDDPEERPGESRRRADLRNTIMLRNGVDARGRAKYREVKAGTRGTDEYQEKFAKHLSSGQMLGGLDFNTGVTKGISTYATLQSDNAERAGYLVASEQMAAELLKEIDDMVFIRRRARVIQVRTADSLGIRKRTGRLSTWGYGSELQVQSEDTSLAYGKKVLTPHHATGLAKVSRDLARRSDMITGELMMEFSRDAAELQEDKYMLGTGDQEPLGVFVASADGISTSRDVNTGSNTDFTPDGILSAYYSLKAGYRNGSMGALSWLFHRDGVAKIAKLKDQNDQYLFRVGIGFGADNDSPDARLLGVPVDESERCPNTFTAGNYVGILANWQRGYYIADALDIEIQVLIEKYALENTIGYVGRMKNDGMPVLDEAFARLKCST